MKEKALKSKACWGVENIEVELEIHIKETEGVIVMHLSTFCDDQMVFEFRHQRDP